MITGPIWASNVGMLGVEWLGVALGLWALRTMTFRNFQILPEVRPGSRLVTQGPYQYIRHPMYSALLLVSFALMVDTYSPARLILWIILVIDLWVKLTYEERLLARQFGEYRDYQQRTKRIIPFLY